MPRKRYSPEQIITKLRQAEVELSRGLRPPQICKKRLSASSRTTGGAKSTAASALTKPSD